MSSNNPAELGLVQFEGLQPNGTYRLTETQAPEAFRKPEGYWIIRLNESGEIEEIQANGTWVLAFREHEGEWFVGNMREIILPEAGRMGTKGLIITGVSTLSLVILLYLNQRIKDEGEAQKD